MSMHKLVQQREAEHRAIGAVDEERLGCSARREHAGGGLGRQPVGSGLGRAHERGLEIGAARLERGVMIVVRSRHGGPLLPGVQNVVRQERIERHVVAAPCRSRLRRNH
jgi:hypothetical protein